MLKALCGGVLVLGLITGGSYASADVSIVCSDCRADCEVRHRPPQGKIETWQLPNIRIPDDFAVVNGVLMFRVADSSTTVHLRDHWAASCAERK